MAKYAIGVDFGTLSARALVAEIGTGRELASCAMEYPHGVMDEFLPSGAPLPPDFALHHPQDYIDCLHDTVPEAIAKAGVSAGDVIGLGIDFTACTLVCVDKGLAPLCFQQRHRDNPHAYVKLWKHHAAQDEANRMTAIAKARGESFLSRYGGKISSEWMFPKIWQVLNEDPMLYGEIAGFIEAADWVIHYLTGNECRSSCAVGYKALWHKKDGYPDSDFFGALDPRLETVVEEKLSRAIYPIGGKAGTVRPEVAARLGLSPDTAVAVANVDAHVSLPPSGLTRSGDMLMIMGTSTCHVMVHEEEKIVPGMCGVVEDGVIPGLMGYEAGQSAVGDQFNWVVENLAPAAYAREAEVRGLSMHDLLTEKAARLMPGESGLMALDWLNGNRSVLVDGDLTGLILGMTLLTRAEDIYRALIEATAYGTKTIIEAFEKSGLEILRLYACGGISHKSPFIMQVYADVLNREIRVARSSQTPALGSAMFGALAAGREKGGYDSIEDAAAEMGGELDIVYRPVPESVRVYRDLYAEYTRLHDHFGRGGNDVMKRLKKIKETQKADR